MKQNYLNALREALKEYQASQKDIDDIISDYSQLYDDAKASGKSDEDVCAMLGEPKDVVDDLRDTLQRKKEKNIKTKIIAVMPFISVLTFFILGFYANLWHPGWMVFLAIPMTAILLQTRLKEGLVALMPFLSVIAFLILGWGFGLWHPGWLVFLAIPMTAILLYTGAKELPVAISPFVATIVFLFLGFYYNLWNPGWLVFLMIPMLGILFEKNLAKKIAYELSFILAIAFYLYMGYVYGSWGYGALGFILPVGLSLILGDMHIGFDYMNAHDRKRALIMTGVVLTAVAAFLALGFLFEGWPWAWQVFLGIPIFAIIFFDKFRMTALIPFFAVIIFFSVGYFANAFHISWLAFLLIPIVAIFENA